MAHLGKRNSLTIIREASPGFYLDGGTHGEILLPGRYIPKGAKPGEPIDVFIYRDSEDRLVATTQIPHVMVDQFGLLRVLSVQPGLGAFLDWGLEKDLLLPMREQAKPVRQGDWLLVHVSVDERTNRILASTKLERWLDRSKPNYEEGDSVNLLIEGETPMGYKAIINHSHRGLLYRAELSGPLVIGQQFDGFVRALRPDGKIDLGLDKVGYRRIAPLTEQIIEALQKSGGHLPYHDKSSPEDIRGAFGVSKKAFKQAVGALYRKQSIRMESDGIHLTPAKSGKSGKAGK